MTTQFKMKGFEEYLEKIAQAGLDIDVAASRALSIAAEIVQEEMQSRAPVKTGNLRDHIKIKGPDQDGHFHSVEIGVISAKGYTDADTARYANAQEYGTATMAAHPYIRPGKDHARKRALAAIKESLKEDAVI